MSKTGNPERGELTSYLFIALFFILNVLFFPTSVYAQSEEEMKILRMFYKEEELVVTPTRNPKPISQVAENISVITSDEIEAMNAHTVAEAIERVTGVFVEFQGHDFGSDAMIYIQGSKEEHVLVLIDGAPWNQITNGKPLVTSIPVRIIQRIEIIKGPASSSWGSSLGGVINIVTKDTNDSPAPSGSFTASYGEGDSRDYSAEVTGKAGAVGYYLYAGRQDSNGLRDNRYFENNSFYSKIDIPVSSGMKFMLTAGYSEPHINHGDMPSYYFTSTGLTRAFFATASLTAELTENLSFETSLYTVKQKYVRKFNDLIDGGEFLHEIYDEETIGGNGKLIWNDNIHTVVLGIDGSNGNLDQAIIASGAESISLGIKKWAVFANDTISLGKLYITPGIRLDHNDATGDFTSPSLGATYKLGERTILRASVARGFTIPLIIYSSGSLSINPNPDLKPEQVWSYQAGVESWVSDYFRVKATVFHHDMKDEIQGEWDEVIGKSIYFNKGEVKRNGVEIDVETASFYNVSLTTGVAYVRKKLYPEDLYPDEDTSIINYAYNLAFRYDDNKSLSAQLAGKYVWWDADAWQKAKYDTFIWDLNLDKKIYSTEKINSEIFLAAHNIFNGSHYTLGDRKNPGRWIEAGVRLRF